MRQEFVQANNVKARKFFPFQGIIMMVFRNNIPGTCRYGTIHELVVIRILLNQVKFKIDVDKPRVRTAHNGIHDIFRSLLIGQQTKDFLILVQYGSGDTQQIRTVKEAIPYLR